MLVSVVKHSTSFASFRFVHSQIKWSNKEQKMNQIIADFLPSSLFINVCNVNKFVVTAFVWTAYNSYGSYHYNDTYRNEALNRPYSFIHWNSKNKIEDIFLYTRCQYQWRWFYKMSVLMCWNQQHKCVKLANVNLQVSSSFGLSKYLLIAQYLNDSMFIRADSVQVLWYHVCFKIADGIKIRWKADASTFLNTWCRLIFACLSFYYGCHWVHLFICDSLQYFFWHSLILYQCTFQSTILHRNFFKFF